MSKSSRISSAHWIVSIVAISRGTHWQTDMFSHTHMIVYRYVRLKLLVCRFSFCRYFTANKPGDPRKKHLYRWVTVCPKRFVYMYMPSFTVFKRRQINKNTHKQKHKTLTHTTKVWHVMFGQTIGIIQWKAISQVSEMHEMLRVLTIGLLQHDAGEGERGVPAGHVSVMWLRRRLSVRGRALRFHGPVLRHVLYGARRAQLSRVLRRHWAT